MEAEAGGAGRTVRAAPGPVGGALPLAAVPGDEDPASKARRPRGRARAGAPVAVTEGEAGAKARRAAGRVLLAVRAAEGLLAGGGARAAAAWVGTLGVEAQLRRVLEAAYESKRAAEDDAAGKGHEEEGGEGWDAASGDEEARAERSAKAAARLREARARRIGRAADLAAVAAVLTRVSRAAKRVGVGLAGEQRTKAD